MPKFLSKLPSIAWVIILPLGLIAFIGGIIITFNIIATVEGVVSVIFLIIGFFSFRSVVSFNSAETIQQKKLSKQFFIASGIVFFALMGMAIDQPGNFIYNKPIEWAYCKEGTTLYRGVSITNPLPGRTDINQRFDCIDKNGNTKFEADMLGIIGIRFVEYVIIGYSLLGINEVIKRMRQNGNQSNIQ